MIGPGDTVAESKIQTSFAAGELSPNLYARVDLDKFTVGAALMSNFYVDYRGGTSNRMGTQYCGKCRTNGARLIPFEFSPDITFMLEFGDHYIRFFQDGDEVIESAEAISAITQANPAQITVTSHGYSSGDELYLNGIGGMVNLNGRNVLINVVDANNFTITDLFGNNINSTSYPAYTSGGNAYRIYTLTSPYALADVFSINYAQSADVLTLTHPSYPPYDLSRTGPESFTMAAETIGPITQPPTGLVVTPSLAGGNNYGYCVTALNQDGTEESLPSNFYVAGSKLLDQTASPPVVNNLTWNAAPGVVKAYNIYKWGPIDKATGAPPTIFGYIGQTKATAFTDNNIAADFSQTPPDFQDPFTPGQLISLTVTNGGSYGTGGGTSYVPLTITDYGGGAGAVGYGVVDYASGKLVAAIIQVGGRNYTAPVITAGSGGAIISSLIGPSSGTYPSVVSYVQQRRTFFAPLNNPEGIVMSQTGNYLNFNDSPILTDSDAITMNLASPQVDYIRSAMPMSTGLVILTNGSAFLLSGGAPGAPITPSQVTAMRQASHGASKLPALGINYDVLYMQQKANTVRDLAFNFYTQSYVGADRSMLSQHLFTDYTFVQWCWAQEPLKLLWAVRGDGVLLTMTYMPEQEVYGWAHHHTQGLFRSVAQVSEGVVDSVYCIVSRYVQNQWVDYVERFTSRNFDCAVDDNMWFVDAAITLEKFYPPHPLYCQTVGGSTGTLQLTTQPDPISTTITTPGDGNYVVPAGIFTLGKVWGIGGGSNGDVWESPISPTSGGGATYAERTNISVTPGQIIPYHVAHGVPGADSGHTQGAAYGDNTWFYSTNPGVHGIFAGGGQPAGGVSSGIGSLVYVGPSGHTNPLDYGPGGGGGGASGPHGPGQPGGGGGTPGPPGSGNGGAGDAGLGGAGGPDWEYAGNAPNGQPGKNGQNLPGNIGAGGGGGGGAGQGNSHGGDGGLYGGGGGVGTDYGAGGRGGAGAQGILQIQTLPFGPFAVDQIVQYGCVQVQLTSVSTDLSTATGTVISGEWPSFVDDPTGALLPAPSGEWTLTTPVSVVPGLWHLEGKIVTGVADGLVVTPRTVTNGQITLDNPAVTIIIGLGYMAQLQTLYLDAQGQQNMQGRRKTVPACTVRVSESRGAKIGRTFEDLQEMEDLMVLPSPTAMPLETGDFRAVLMSDWEVTGQVCIQQDYPLPLTVLGVIPEFLRGDTAN